MIYLFINIDSKCITETSLISLCLSSSVFVFITWMNFDIYSYIYMVTMC